MLRDAANEIRFHPSRFVATLLAVGISVGFIVAILATIRTEENAIARNNSLATAKADIVVSGYFPETSEAKEAIAAVPGVTAVEEKRSTGALLTHDPKTKFVNVFVVFDEQFRWAKIASGAWPTAPNEVALGAKDAKDLGVGIGDELSVQGGAEDLKLKVAGITDDPSGLFSGTAYVSASSEAVRNDGFLVKGADPKSVIPAIEKALGDKLASGNKVQTADDYRADQLKQLIVVGDVFRVLLLAFAGIATFVGMIIIANTFTILITQRRRQIGLRRAVGASTGQVAWQLVFEAAMVGFIGGLLGLGIGYLVALIVSMITGSIYWGLAFNPLELIVALLVGVLVTVASAIIPSFRATRISPLEALQPVPTAQQAKRLGITRMVFSGLFALFGAAFFAMALSDTGLGFVWAMLASMSLSLMLFIAAPFYVPVLVRGLGKVFSLGKPTPRIAVGNVVRNPRRASATAVALMVAVGLIVTIQASASTVRSTGVQAINERFPVDVTMSSRNGAIDVAVADRVRSSGAVDKVVQVHSKETEIANGTVTIRNSNSALAELGLGERNKVKDDEIVIYSGVLAQDKVDVPGVGSLKVVKSESMEYGAANISETNYAKLSGSEQVSELWVKLTDRKSMTALNDLSKIASENQLLMGGGGFFAGILETVVDVFMMILTGLLGVAVVIALVGVGNTLGLSVIERQRESALLRALGMQRGSLRMMLLAEALLIGVVGVGVGVLSGLLFSWLGVTTALRSLTAAAEIDIPLVFSADPLYTGGLVAVCILAAALASVLPGRRAAKATPMEALAAD